MIPLRCPVTRTGSAVEGRKLGEAMGIRRQARVYALQILFQWDIHAGTGDWLKEFWAERDVSPDLRSFTDQLVEGVLEHHVEIDRLIGACATNWAVHRMPVVDRNILRVSLYELLWVPDVPAKVTVNEAIELAKVFADEEARRFVNGILDRVLKEDARLEKKRAEMVTEAPEQ